MLNPDGVIFGNYRTSIASSDLIDNLVIQTNFYC